MLDIHRKMECPKCKLTNSENAQICDCGYNFNSRRLEPIKPESAKSHSYGKVLIISLIVSSIICFGLAYKVKNPKSNKTQAFVSGKVVTLSQEELLKILELMSKPGSDGLYYEDATQLLDKAKEIQEKQKKNSKILVITGILLAFSGLVCKIYFDFKKG